MTKTLGMTKSQNHVDHFDRMRFKKCDNGGVASWADIDDDVLFLLMMRLGVIDFLAFSEVCKSWRLLALSYKKKFMASSSPMLVWITYKKCYLKDFEGRRFKTCFPHFPHSRVIGLTCGYLILFGRETEDFWLVNPITSHQLCFPFFTHFNAPIVEERARAVLVFSPSISGWVFIVTYRLSHKIWFSIAGKEGWNHVSSAFPIVDLHAFKGKIYVLNKNLQLLEMSLNPEPKLTLLEIKNSLKPCFIYPKFVSAGENLYVIDHIPFPEVHKLDFVEMKWVLPGQTIEEYAFFLRMSGVGASVVDGAAIKLDPWARSQYKKYDSLNNSKKGRFFVTIDMWYFPHESMNVKLID